MKKEIKLFPVIGENSKSRSVPKLADNQLNVLSKFIDKTGDCWVWTGAKNSDGYGYIKIDYVAYRAHRVMYYNSKGGSVDLSKVLDHLCYNRACVNPSHLEEISQEENMARAYKRKERK